jgi:hypothetical protein
MTHSKYFSDRKAAVTHLRRVVDAGATRAEIAPYVGGFYVHWQA